ENVGAVLDQLAGDFRENRVVADFDADFDGGTALPHQHRRTQIGPGDEGARHQVLNGEPLVEVKGDVLAEGHQVVLHVVEFNVQGGTHQESGILVAAAEVARVVHVDTDEESRVVKHTVQMSTLHRRHPGGKGQRVAGLRPHHQVRPGGVGGLRG